MKLDEELTIKYTGKRVVPNRQDMNYFQCMAGYEFVTTLVAGRDVLDVGCGTGFGAEILIDAQARIYVGMAIASDAIAFVHRKYSLSNVSFTQMDALSLGFLSRIALT